MERIDTKRSDSSWEIVELVMPRHCNFEMNVGMAQPSPQSDEIIIFGGDEPLYLNKCIVMKYRNVTQNEERVREVNFVKPELVMQITSGAVGFGGGAHFFSTFFMDAPKHFTLSISKTTCANAESVLEEVVTIESEQTLRDD